MDVLVEYSNESTSPIRDSNDHSNYGAGIFFLFIAFSLGAGVRHLLKDTSLPYTVILIVLGMLLGGLPSWSPLAFTNDYLQIARLDPHLMLIIFLPTLIFESAFALDVHTFKKMIGQAIVLAGPGLLVSSFLLSILSRFIFPYGWSWIVSMLFGTVLSATDPVAIVALLKDLGASKQLGTIIEGESLLNDGAAIVLYNVLIDELIPGRGRDAIQIFLYFLRVALGGPVFGYIMAKISILWLSRVYNDALVEIAITLVAAYVTYYIGENLLHVSGVLAVVALGYEINSRKTNISPEVEVFLHRFWEVLGYLANTLIFIIVGIVIRQNFEDVESTDWILLIPLYFGIIIIRMIVTVAFFPILNHIGYSMNIREIIVIAWGGLKGAVSLALALSVAETSAIDFNNIGSKFLFHTAGIVMLTLIINATTTKCLLGLLGMRRISAARSKTVSTAVEGIHDTKKRAISLLKGDRFLADANWEIVNKFATVPNPYKKSSLMVMGGGYFLPCKLPEETGMDGEEGHNEHAEITEEIRRLIVKKEKTSYWHQFELGMLSREAARVLINLADTVLDVPERLITVDDISPHWHIPRIYSKLHQLIDWVIEQNTYFIPEPNNVLLKAFYRIATSAVLEWMIISVIIINLTLSGATIFVVEQFNARPLVVLVLGIFNYVFYTAYILEAFIKIIGLRMYYWRSKWSYLELIILLIIITVLVLSQVFSSSRITIIILTSSSVILLIRFVQAKKSILPLLLKLIGYFANRHLRFGYDIGRGFVVGEEELLSQFERFIHIDESVAKKFKKSIEETRLSVIRSLGLIRKEYPRIALSVKTHHATRAVLNSCKETVRNQLSNGLLDEADAAKLIMLIERKTKSLENTQASLPTPSPETLFSQISWLNGLSNDVIVNLRRCASVEQFDTGDVLIEKEQSFVGVFILISGLVKSVATALTDQGEEEVIVDFYGPGDVLGEIGMVLNISDQSEIGYICETDTQTFFIDHDNLIAIMKDFPILQERLWKIYGTRTAISLLESLPLYQDYTANMLSRMSDNSYVGQPTLDDPLPQIFDITDEMCQVIVIHDEVHCSITNRAFKAPSIIPKRIHHVTMETYEPRLLIIMNEDQQMKHENEAVMEEENLSIFSKIKNRILGRRKNVVFMAEEGLVDDNESRLIRNLLASDPKIAIPHLNTVVPTVIPHLNTAPNHSTVKAPLVEKDTRKESDTKRGRKGDSNSHDDGKMERLAVTSWNIPNIITTGTELTRSQSALVVRPSRGQLSTVSSVSIPARLIGNTSPTPSLTPLIITDDTVEQPKENSQSTPQAIVLYTDTPQYQSATIATAQSSGHNGEGEDHEKKRKEMSTLEVPGRKNEHKKREKRNRKDNKELKPAQDPQSLMDTRPYPPSAVPGENLSIEDDKAMSKPSAITMKVKEHQQAASRGTVKDNEEKLPATNVKKRSSIKDEGGGGGGTKERKTSEADPPKLAKDLTSPSALQNAYSLTPPGKKRPAVKARKVHKPKPN